MDFVMNMAQNMQKYEASDYITAHYIQQLEYNEPVCYIVYCVYIVCILICLVRSQTTVIASYIVLYLFTSTIH